MIRTEKTEVGTDIVISGFEQGTQPSPHKGTANIQNANISTEMGEVINSFSRTQNTMTSSATGTGSLTFVDSSHVGLTIAGSNNLFKGNWITVSASSNTSQLPNGTYYVNPSTGANFQLSSYYNTLDISGGLPVTASYLLVGGGGGGGNGFSGDSGGGGGGAGQVTTGTASLNVGTYTVTVDPGGAAVTDGGTTSAFSATAAGGHHGLTGSSGFGNTGGASGSGKTGGGFTGFGGGGGAGDSVNGTNASGNNGGVGGNGTSNSITGSAITYAGGGGGASVGTSTGASGGSGGGGTGGGNSIVATAGTANTGSGGGAGSGGVSTVPGAAGGSGIVVVSFPTGSLIGVTGGTITFTDTNEVHTFTSSGTLTVPAQPTATNPLTGFTTGLTATIQLVALMGKPIATTTQPETYFLNGVPYNRYYVLDNQNLVWVYDTQNEITYSASDNVNWFLPDYQTGYTNVASGIAVISGFLIVTTDTGIVAKSTTTLGQTNAQTTTWAVLSDSNRWAGSGQSTSINHFCLTTHTDQLYITDASYIVGIFPDAALASPGLSTTQNVQSQASWTLTNATEGLMSVVNGTTTTSDDSKRVPAVFFTVNGGILPASMTAGTVYYISTLSDNIHFQVFAASTGGSALDIEAGAFGPQYFNTFYPIASASASTGGTPTYTFTNPQVALPVFEIAQCMAEIGTTVLIGCVSNIVYPWNQTATQATTQIPLPEANTVQMITVNQMAYIFAGNKGNIYITDGSVASLVSTVPDYCAGVPGTPSTYVEPVFIWGGGGYVRGRVYFSIFDQTATKAGNCGGIWSFTPTQNFYIGQDVGIALRLENQSSYGTYNGYAPLIIPKIKQTVASPQYFSAWQSTLSSPLYGIDTTGTGTSSTSVAVVETDLIPTGTMLSKRTFAQIEYKLSSPLPSGATVALNYRVDATSAWQSCGTLDADTSLLSGYYPVNFQVTQWLQLQAILTPTTISPGGFIRLFELRVR